MRRTVILWDLHRVLDRQMYKNATVGPNRTKATGVHKFGRLWTEPLSNTKRC